MHEEFPDACVGTALFLPPLGELLPTAAEGKEDRTRGVASRFLVEGRTFRAWTETQCDPLTVGSQKEAQASIRTRRFSSASPRR